MLGPFRIRHLSRPPSPPGQRSFPRTTPIISARDVVVSLTGSEYDRTVSEHPESKLKYVDEDDGEVVTVGSQFELSQRLEEPVPLSSKISPTSVIPAGRRRSSVGSWNSSEMRPLESSMHVFDVDPVESARLVWEEIENRTKEHVENLSNTDLHEELNETQEPLGGFPPNTAGAVSTQIQVDDNTLAGESEELRSARSPETRAKIEAWRAKRTARRNRLSSHGEKSILFDPASSTRSTTKMKLADVLSDAEPELSAEETWPLLKKSRSHFLTPEGRRQAKEAGIKLRQRLASMSNMNSRDFSDVTADCERWASYSEKGKEATASSTKVAPSGKDSNTNALKENESLSTTSSTTPLPPLLPSLRVDPSGTLQADGYGEQSLFESFRAELAKLGQANTEFIPASQPNLFQKSPSPEVKSEENTFSSPPFLPAPPSPCHSSEIPVPSQEHSQSIPILDPRSVQVSVSKLLMRTLDSIAINMSELNFLIKDNVVRDLEAHELSNAEGSKDYVAVKHSLKCFDEEVVRIVELLDLVQTKSETFPAGSGKLNLFSMTTAASTVKSFGEAINRLHKSLYSTCTPTDNDTTQSLYGKTPQGDQSGIWRFMIRPIPKWASFREVQDFVDQTLRDACHPEIAIHDVRVRVGVREDLTWAFFEVHGESEALKVEDIFKKSSWAGEFLTVKKGMVGSRFVPVKPKSESTNSKSESKEPSTKPDMEAALTAIRNKHASRNEMKAKRQSVRFEDPPSCSSDIVKEPSLADTPYSGRESLNSGYRHVAGRLSFDSIDLSDPKIRCSGRRISVPDQNAALADMRHQQSEPLHLKNNGGSRGSTIIHDSHNHRYGYSRYGEPLRGRQSVRSLPTDRKFPYEYIQPPPEKVVHKRMSMPVVSSRQQERSCKSPSRSRSRSPSRSPTGSYARDRGFSPTMNPRLRRARSARFVTEHSPLRSSSKPVPTPWIGVPSKENANDRLEPKSFKPEWWERKPWWDASPERFSYDKLPNTEEPSRASAGLKKDVGPPVALKKRFSVPSFVKPPPPGNLEVRNTFVPLRASSLKQTPGSSNGYSSSRAWTFVNEKKPPYVPVDGNWGTQATVDEVETTGGAKADKSDQLSPPLAEYFEKLRSRRDRAASDTTPHASEPHFPPLPSMEPLIPLRASDNKVQPVPEKLERQSNGVLPSSTAMATPSRLGSKEPSTLWAQATSTQKSSESSGEFFSRMTGRPNSPPTLPLPHKSSVSRASPLPYYNPAIRRSATVSEATGRPNSTTLRRPYSQVFDGKGRIEWNNFLRDPRPAPTPGPPSIPPKANAPGQGRQVFVLSPNRGEPPVPIEEYNARPGNFCDLRHITWNPARNQPATVPQPKRSAARFDEESAPPAHDNAETAGKIQECVDKLRYLGYGSSADGGNTRLVVYAQAADGEVGEAVDLIEEERRAWGERRF